MHKFFLSTLFFVCTATEISVQAMEAEQETTELVPWRDSAADEKAAQMPSGSHHQTDAALAAKLSGMTITSDNKTESKNPTLKTQKTTCLRDCWNCLAFWFCCSQQSELSGIEDIRILEKIPANIINDERELCCCLCDVHLPTVVKFKALNESANNQEQRKIVCEHTDESENPSTLAALFYTVKPSEIHITRFFLSPTIAKNTGIEYLLLFVALIETWKGSGATKIVICETSAFTGNALIPVLEEAGFTEDSKTPATLTVDLSLFAQNYARKILHRGRKLFLNKTSEAGCC